MRILVLLTAAFPAFAFAQWEPPSSTTDPFDDEMETYFDFGPNFSLDAKNNYSTGFNNYEHYITYSWHGFDDEDEPIDEIVVTAQRRVGHGWELYMFLDLNFSGNEMCTSYTDGGHCNATEIVYDPEFMPIAAGCQTVSGSTGPLTGEQANELNVEYLNGQHIGASLFTASASYLGYLVGGGAGAIIGAMGAAVTTYQGFIGELPFTAGDNVTWELTACNDGEGGIDATMDVTID